MMYAICTVATAAVRNAPDHKAEMVSQLLFGECCLVTEIQRDGFAHITIKADGYQGWCQLQHLTEITETLYNEPATMLAGAWANKLLQNGTALYIPFGSSLKGGNGTTFKWGAAVFEFEGDVHVLQNALRDEATILQLATSFLNTPYLWGGRSVFGIDCSGFTQVLYKFLNIEIARDAHQQASQGTIVDFLQQAQCGDLAFFDDDNGHITHTGVLLNDHEIIHASGKVQVDDIDNGGIISRQTGLRTQRLRIIKRYF